MKNMLLFLSLLFSSSVFANTDWIGWSKIRCASDDQSISFVATLHLAERPAFDDLFVKSGTADLPNAAYTIDLKGGYGRDLQTDIFTQAYNTHMTPVGIIIPSGLVVAKRQQNFQAQVRYQRKSFAANCQATPLD